MKRCVLVFAAVLLGSCGSGDGGSSTVAVPPGTSGPTPTASATPATISGVTQSAAVATFDKPWAIAMLPDGRMLVSQRSASGALWLVSADGTKKAVGGLPQSIGVLDVKLAPDYASTRQIFITYMVEDRAALRVGRAKDEPTLFPQRMEAAHAVLGNGTTGPELSNVVTFFRQDPAIVAFDGSGEPGGRMAFSPDGRYLFLTSGDRQELDASFLFDLSNTLGKILRFNRDGSIPADNPFAASATAKKEIWTIGHRNQYGLAFTRDGLLWSAEMGPKGGDELNVVKPGLNYGWPAVSNGDNYVGPPIPDHAPGDGYEAPVISWTPVIAPAGMIVCKGKLFADWSGDILLTGLQSRGIVRVRPMGTTATEVQRIDLGTRIRDIAEAPDGALWILTDGVTGELRRLSPLFN